MAAFIRTVRFDVVSGLASWRWLAVPPVFGLACWNQISDDLVTGSGGHRAAAMNFWDGPLSMLLDTNVVTFVLALGFLLIVGDRYLQDRSRGTVALTVIRTRSRTAWWLARLTSIGVLALAFSAVGLTSALVVSAIRLPLELDPSASAQLAWGTPGALYPRFSALPMPVFFGVVCLYTGVALWAPAALVLAASVLRPQLYVPAGIAILWVLLEALALPSLASRGGGSADPFYHLSFAAHFASGGPPPASWGWSAVVISAAIACAGAAGLVKLRRSDI
jgi:hypothetical protein